MYKELSLFQMGKNDADNDCHTQPFGSQLGVVRFDEQGGLL